jgi:hypothetical protein
MIGQDTGFYDMIIRKNITHALFMQLLCQLVFTQKYQFHPNLLCDPPAGIAESLKRVLKECSKPGPSHMDWNLYNELKDLLTNSIQQL